MAHLAALTWAATPANGMGLLFSNSPTELASIAGYTPLTDVTHHLALDLDQQAMVTALEASDFETAMQIYSAGGNSIKSSGAHRTIKGFSTSAKEKMNDCAGCEDHHHFKHFYNYYGDYDYADKWVSAAIAGEDMEFSSGKHGPNNFASLSDVTRMEAAKKGAAYMNVWMYVIREFEDAIDDCEMCDSGNCNGHSYNANVQAWDEAVAFYAGSLEGTGGSSDGVFPYRLAEKRCKDFKTCGPNGGEIGEMSQVNIQLLKLFNEGDQLLHAGQCTPLVGLVDKIVSLMTVPLVQGVLRYAFKLGHETDHDVSDKNAAEYATFAAAVLPLVAQCSPEAAEIVSKYSRLGSFESGSHTGHFPSVKLALESTYACLGITCAHVGGLVDEDGASLDAAQTAACID